MKKSLKRICLALLILIAGAVLTGCTGETENKAVGLGETFVFDDLEITLGKEIKFTKIDNEFSDHNGKTVVKMPITVKNIKEETHSLNLFYYTVYGANGSQVDSVSSYFDDSVDFAGDLRSGASYTKYLYFLYDADGTYAIEFDDWTTKVTIEFNVKK